MFAHLAASFRRTAWRQEPAPPCIGDVHPLVVQPCHFLQSCRLLGERLVDSGSAVLRGVVQHTTVLHRESEVEAKSG